MVRSRITRVGLRFDDFTKRMKTKIDPLLDRPISKTELTDRIARYLDDEAIIEASIRQLRRKRRR